MAFRWRQYRVGFRTLCELFPPGSKLLLTCNKANRKGPVYRFMLPFNGPGILTGGPTWRIHRKLANPSYGKKAVARYVQIFNREVTELVQTFLDKKPGESFDVYFDIVKCTTQCVCQTLFGLSKEDSQNIKHLDEIVLNTQRTYDVLFKKMTRWWLQVPLINWLTGGLREEQKIMQRLDTFSSDILDKRRRALKGQKVDDEDIVGVVDRYSLSGDLTDQEIKHEIFTLFTTSQEASAKIASSMLLFMAHLPEWQEKVYIEIVEQLGAEDGPVSQKQVKRLQYLDMVFKETLRYFSIGAMLQRTVEEEVTINDGKITIPAGTSLVIPIHEMHRDPKYWDEPQKVKPERFLPENVAKRDPNAFIPFGLGPMDCLAYTVGHLQGECRGPREMTDPELLSSAARPRSPPLRAAHPPRLNDG